MKCSSVRIIHCRWLTNLRKNKSKLLIRRRREVKEIMKFLGVLEWRQNVEVWIMIIQYLNMKIIIKREEPRKYRMGCTCCDSFHHITYSIYMHNGHGFGEIGIIYSIWINSRLVISHDAFRFNDESRISWIGWLFIYSWLLTLCAEISRSLSQHWCDKLFE